MEDSISKHFRGWVKSDIWQGTSTTEFYQALNRVYNELGMIGLDTDDFEKSVWKLIKELQPDSDRKYVAAIIEECCGKIEVLNDFFDANDIYELTTP